MQIHMAAILSSPARPARQQPGAAGAEAARRGRCGSSSARQERQRYGADGMGVTAGAAGMGVTAGAAPNRRGPQPTQPARSAGVQDAAGAAGGRQMAGAGYNHGGATGYTRQQLRRRTGEGAAVDSEDWSLRPAGPAHPAEPRHSPVRRGTQDKHGWLGQRQWKRQ